MRLSRALRRLAMALGAIGFATSAMGQSGFASVSEARQYLDQNPTGARAAEAFRVIVRADLAQEYPQYPHRGSAFGRTRIGTGAGLSDAEISQALRDVAGAGASRRAASRASDDDGDDRGGFGRSGGGGGTGAAPAEGGSRGGDGGQYGG